ncbi:FtsX-like permease family protein [Ruminococcus sp. Marseille-P6503]|uniref:FtsX-like permease family protein n=1 Tax=Ruminococcus sp. Marseille-P6503 TaxID=2364796 RepID=UPI000F521A44|nr:FtsX-like permease family protein [Ruminococcus sp. Marseille-P6503]
MNTLSIVAKNLKNFISKHTLVFIIMLAALTVSTITILYVTVKLDTLSDGLSAGDLELDQIRLKNTESLLAIDDISDRLQSYYENNSSVLCVQGCIDTSDAYVTCFITDEKKNLADFSEKYKPISGSFFSDEDIENGNNVMVSVGIGTELKSVSLGDEEIKITGSYAPDGISNGYIPKNTVVNNGIIPDEYKIIYSDELSVRQAKEYKGQLEELFPEFEIETRMDYVLKEAPLMLDFENVCLILMAVVAVISCAYLYAYVIQMRINEIYIFKLCGASAARLARIFLCELLLLLMLQFFTAFIIFRLCLINILKKYDFAFTYGYSWIHTVITFGIIIALSLMVFAPVLIYYCRKNAVEIRQQQKG